MAPQPLFRDPVIEGGFVGAGHTGITALDGRDWLGDVVVTAIGGKTPPAARRASSARS